MKNKKLELYISIIFIVFVLVFISYKIVNQKVPSNETETKNTISTNESNNTINEIITNSVISNISNTSINTNEQVIEENTVVENANSSIDVKQNTTNNNEILNIENTPITSSFDETNFNNGHLEKHPTMGENYATLIINKIAVNAPIIYGATQETILSGVGHDSNSYFPGENGSIIMCEHNYMNNFARLGELINGDIIEVKTNYGDFFYKLYDEQIILETENSKLPIQSEKEILMIYTCFPFEGTNHTQYRYVIYAEKI